MVACRKELRKTCVIFLPSVGFCHLKKKCSFVSAPIKRKNRKSKWLNDTEVGITSSKPTFFFAKTRRRHKVFNYLLVFHLLPLCQKDAQNARASAAFGARPSLKSQLYATTYEAVCRLSRADCRWTTKSVSGSRC